MFSPNKKSRTSDSGDEKGGHENRFPAVFVSQTSNHEAAHQHTHHTYRLQKTFHYIINVLDIIKSVIRLLTIIPKSTGTVTTKNILTAIDIIEISLVISTPIKLAELNTINGTTALNMYSLTKGAKILRVHDVKEVFS